MRILLSFIFILSFICSSTQAATETITGTVTDSVTGDPIKAVMVTVKGGTDSVYTDANGDFTINAETGILRPAPVHLDMNKAELLRTFNAAGKPVCTQNLPDGVYLQELELEGERYIASVVKAGDRIHSGYAGISQTRAKAAGTAALMFGKCRYREKETGLSGGVSGQTVKMRPLAADEFPAVPSEAGTMDPTILTPSGTITVTTNDVVIENVDVTGYIHIKDAVDNITVRNFRITTETYWGIYIRNGATTNVLIENGEIRGNNVAGDAIPGHDYTARNVYIHNMGGDAFKCFGSSLIEHCYITAIGQADGAHGDGVQGPWSDGTYGNVTIQYNNFLLNSGHLTACIFVGNYIPNTQVIGNRLSGGSYTVYCAEHIHLTDNIFGRDDAYGAHTGTCGTWENNVWFDTGELVP